MALDGASVMLSHNNGVAAKLKAIAPSVIAVHSICIGLLSLVQIPTRHQVDWKAFLPW